MDVLLYATQNPANFGSMIRTSVEFGLPRIHLYDRFNLLGDYNSMERVKKVCRRNRHEDIDIILVDNPLEFILQHENPYATVLIKRSAKLDDLNFKFAEDALLIFGNEATDLPREICRKKEIRRVRIKTIESLSLPIAYGIFLYEYLRQYPDKFPKMRE